MQAEIAAVVRNHIHVTVLDVERAQRIILSRLASAGEEQATKTEEYDGLTWLVQQELCSQPVDLPAGVLKVFPDLNEIKAKLVTREALQALHVMGAIVAVGGDIGTSDDINFSFATERSSGDLVGIKLSLPVAAYSYCPAAKYRNERSRLVSGAMYLTEIDTTHLPSRAKRCIDESINAFRHGLYLSAVLNIGAASENIWIELARLVDKVAPTTGLTKALKDAYTHISTIVEETWKALQSNCSARLDAVFAVGGQQRAFKEHADRLREHRNYAAHVGDASLDEYTFTYEETGMLLLDATGYFDKLVTLYAQFAVTP